MTDRVFIDSNIWVYVVDDADPVKQGIARGVLEPGPDVDLVISAQVLGEFFTVVTRKFKDAVPDSDARAMVAHMSELPVVPIDARLVQAAIAGTVDWQLSYWDALIIAAADVSGCRRVISEDMTNGAIYGSVRVENPFLVSESGSPAG